MDPLSSYKITDLDVVHLVAKTAEQVENSISNEENTMNSESSNTRRRDTSIFNLMNRLIRPEYDNNEASVVNLGKQVEIFFYKFKNIYRIRSIRV